MSHLGEDGWGQKFAIDFLSDDKLQNIMPAKRSNPKTMHRAGELRKELTDAERKLWAYLRGDKSEDNMQSETTLLILFQLKEK